MSERLRYIILSIAVVIGTSLVLSTYHYHETVSWSPDNDQQQVEHTVTGNTALCPICGYLVKSNSPDAAPGATFLDGFFLVTRDSQPAVDKKSRSLPFTRAPPVHG